MIKAYILKIKKEKESQWIEWCKKIQNELQDEAINSLREEKVYQELVLSFMIEDQMYCLAYMDGECLPSNPEREINIKHKKMKDECIESVMDARLLYNIKD